MGEKLAELVKTLGLTSYELRVPQHSVKQGLWTG